MNDSVGVDELRSWLEDGYAGSLRTAYLIMGNRLDAEDAVQEAYLLAWRHRNSLVKKSSFKPWLYRVVVNTCNSKLRTEIPHRERRIGDGNLSETWVGGESDNQFASSQDIITALNDLPFHLRVAVVLRYYADLSEREIAVAIQRQPGTVKSRLNEARRRLADHPALRSERTNYSTVKETPV
jgi:RNA polymerase sigma-70 factor (ECF subfamily)